jgi:hypothetical protein
MAGLFVYTLIHSGKRDFPEAHGRFHDRGANEVFRLLATSGATATADIHDRICS